MINLIPFGKRAVEALVHLVDSVLQCVLFRDFRLCLIRLWNEIDILFIENDRAFKSFGERHVFELYLAFYVLKRMLRFGQLLQ